MNPTVSMIHKRLTKALTPSHLDIIDESKYHVGHAGAQNGAGHYFVTISSPDFKVGNLIYNHQLVYKALDGLIPNTIHALKIKILC